MDNLFRIVLVLLGVSGFSAQSPTNCLPTQTVVDVAPNASQSECQHANSSAGSTIQCPDLEAALSMQNLSDKCIVIWSRQSLGGRFNISGVVNLMLTSASGDEIFDVLLQSNDAGLTFFKGGDIAILDLNFNYVFDGPFDGRHSKFLHFNNAVNVKVKTVRISNQHGHAMFFTISEGVVIINDVNITNSNYTLFSGKSAGIFMEFFGNDTKTVTISGKFSNLTNLENDTECIIKSRERCGKGAGLALFFRHSVANTYVSIKGSLFENSQAFFGAGVYINFPKASTSNVVDISHCEFIKNNANFSGGGLMLVGVMKFDHLKLTPNKLSASNNSISMGFLRFHNCQSEKGGGMSLWNLDSASCSTILSNSHYSSNSARLGADVYLTRTSANMVDVFTTQSLCQTKQGQQGFGSIVSFGSLIVMQSAHLTKHTGSGIILDTSNLHINGSVNITYNKAKSGGGIALYGNSRIHLSGYSYLTIANNVVSEKGGGMFVSSSKFFDCFFDVAKNFSGKVSFLNNTSNQSSGTAVYSKTLAGCVENPEDKSSFYKVIFNWTGFEVNCAGNGKHCICTDPITISSTWKDWDMKQPGITLSVKIVLVDERNNIASMPVQVRTNDAVRFQHNQSMVEITSNAQPYFIGEPGSKFKITIFVSSYLTFEISNLTLGNCSRFYKLKNGQCSCDRNNSRRLSISRCEPGKIYLIPNRWLGNTSSKAYSCPNGYCFCNNMQPNNITNDKVDCLYVKGHQCNNTRDQTSRLCSRCKNGSAVRYGSNVCSNNCPRYNWIKLVVFVLLSDTMITFFIIVLNCESYATYINSVISCYKLLDYFVCEKFLPRDPVRILVTSLFYRSHKNTFDPGTCVSDDLDNLGRLWVEFGLIPSWFIAYFLNYFLIYKKSLVPYVSKRLPRDAYFRSMSTIALIVYFEVMIFAFQALHYIEIEGFYVYVYAEERYFSKRHTPIAVVAIIVLIFILGYVALLFINSLQAKAARRLMNGFFDGRLENTKPFFQFQKSSYKQHELLCRDRTWFLPLQYAMITAFLAFGEFYMETPRDLFLTMTCLMMLTLHVLSVPYKAIEYNVFETILLFDLVVIGLLGESIQERSYKLIVACLLYIPVVGLLFWVVVFILKVFCKCPITFKRQRRRYTDPLIAILPPKFLMDARKNQ